MEKTKNVVKILSSKLEKLDFDEEVIINLTYYNGESFTYGITRMKILDGDYIISALHGGGSDSMMFVYGLLDNHEIAESIIAYLNNGGVKIFEIGMMKKVPKFEYFCM